MAMGENNLFWQFLGKATIKGRQNQSTDGQDRRLTIYARKSVLV